MKPFLIYKVGTNNWELVEYYISGELKGLKFGHCNHVSFEEAIACAERSWK